MSHAKLTQARMLDWIRACLDTDAPLPTDEAIMGQFDLPSTASARSLLADLSDAGKITIFGTGADRRIVLGIVKRPLIVTPRPTPTIVKRGARAPDEAETFAKIKAALARGKRALNAEAERKFVLVAHDSPPLLRQFKAPPGNIGRTTPAPVAPLAPEPKPLVPAEITAAAIRAGVPICDFVRELLARGFAVYLREVAA